jgi:hypothetical protein
MRGELRRDCKSAAAANSGAGDFVPVPVAFLRGVCDGLFVADGVCAVRSDGGDYR